MRRLLLNADAGEGAPGNQLDLRLLELVDALNIALGGHAGDPEWSRELAARATAAGRAVHLHPGYPDREHFGRRELELPWKTLADALSRQRAVLPAVRVCKFHGALYNQAARDHDLAQRLAGWALAEGIETLLAPPQSALAAAATEAGLGLLREGFADRGYVLTAEGVALAPRDRADAVHRDLERALAQARRIATHARVDLLDGGSHPLPCDTLCLHGDGPMAQDLATALRGLFAAAGPALTVRAGHVRVAGGPDRSRLHQGHAPGGAHDRWSQARANALLGNPPEAGVIEGLLRPLVLRAERPCQVVVGGCPATVTIDGAPAGRWRVLGLRAGSVLQVVPGRIGCRSVIALAGGASGEAPEILAATPDRLLAADPDASLPPQPARPPWAAPLGVIRAVPGPEATPARIVALAGSWRIDARSDGIGLRLEGRRLPGPDFDIPSSPVVDGTIQATAAGVIVLLRERGTLGGYPRIGRVLAPDLDVCAQLRPGAAVRLEILDEPAASRIEAAYRTALRQLLPGSPSIAPGRSGA